MRILVVDDDANIRAAVRVMLEWSDMEVVEARGGFEAVELFRRSGADLILCDVFMPEGDGLELLRALCRANAGVKVITMSGGGNFHGTIDILPMASFLGAVGVLHKPFTRAELRAAVARAFQPAGA